MSESFFSGNPVKLSNGEGWALMITGDKAHHWKKFAFNGLPAGYDQYESLCGLRSVSGPKTPPLDPGNWPKCKKCLAKELKG